jgi:hypothetical protein
MRRSSLALLVLAAAAAAVGGPATAAAPGVPSPPATPFGALLTPAHFPFSTEDEKTQAFLEIAAFGSHVSAQWEWRNGDSDYVEMVQIMPMIGLTGMKSFLQLNPTAAGQPGPPPGYTPTFADPVTRARFLYDAARLAALRPDYLNLGAEINLLYLWSPVEYSLFASLYQSAYALVKQISPNTQVGVSYHLDVFYIYGGPQLRLIDQIGPQDYVAFTTYPSWTVYNGIFPSIDAIPSSYYTRILQDVPDKPIVFSEVGWPSGGSGNLFDQADYIASLPRLMGDVKPIMITWGLLHDVIHFQISQLTPQQLLTLNSINPSILFDELDTMGLYSWDGPPKPALLEVYKLRFDPPR